MAELTDREKIIVHEMQFLMNPTTSSVPFDIRLLALTTILKIRDLKISEPELKDLSHAIEDEQKAAVKESMGYLDKHKDSLKRMGNF